MKNKIWMALTAALLSLSALNAQEKQEITDYAQAYNAI